MSGVGKKHKTAVEHAAQIEKMHSHITEVCDRECRESVHQWIRTRQEENAYDRQSVENEESSRAKINP